FNDAISWSGGLFNNWLDTDNGFTDNPHQIIGRFTWLPYLSEDENELFHLGIGMRFSNSEVDLHYKSTPEFYISPTFIDSGTLNANSSFTYNLEASWRKGPLWISSEYTETNIDSPEQGDPTLSGYYISAALSLTGEMREFYQRNATYSALAVSQSVEQGGLGAWELTSRWSVFDGNSGQLNSGKTEIFSLGLFWWLNPKFNISLNYRWLHLEGCSLLNSSCDLVGNSNGMNLRLMMML
ncbi:MAG: hypothetical protein DRQ47_00735, partial [Gammaproteobacteria bacterium]